MSTSLSRNYSYNNDKHLISKTRKIDFIQTDILTIPIVFFANKLY